METYNVMLTNEQRKEKMKNCINIMIVEMTQESRKLPQH